MILVINRKESATLTLNLLRMRKSYRNLIKAQYKARKEELYKSYDYISESVKNALESQSEVNEVHFNRMDLEMLSEVLRSYTDKLDALDLKNEEDVEQIQIMKDLYLRCEGLLTA